MSDRQLTDLARHVYKEISRRVSDKKVDDEFKRHLVELRTVIPEKCLKDETSRSIRAPQALRQEDLIAPPGQRLKYLNSLLAQNWAYLWDGCDDSKKYMVYAHVDPHGKLLPLSPKIGGTTYMPFYIGKGTKQRAFDLNRNQGHGIRLKQILHLGFKSDKIVHIFASGLSEGEAFELESKLIYFFGTVYEKTRKGVLLNLDLALRPNFVSTLSKI